VAIENELRCALDDLEVTSVLQSRNRVDIEALLNPSEESWMMEATMDEEICQAVLAAQKEGPNSGNNDVEDTVPLELLKSREM